MSTNAEIMKVWSHERLRRFVRLMNIYTRMELVKSISRDRDGDADHLLAAITFLATEGDIREDSWAIQGGGTPVVVIIAKHATKLWEGTPWLVETVANIEKERL